MSVELSVIGSPSCFRSRKLGLLVPTPCVQKQNLVHAYSYRSATIGSMRVARRDGMWHATNATRQMTPRDAAYTVASPACTPYSSDSLSRASPYAAGNPTSAPAITIHPTSLNTSPLTCPAAAPSASRSEEHTSELQSRFDLVCRLL